MNKYSYDIHNPFTSIFYNRPIRCDWGVGCMKAKSIVLIGFIIVSFIFISISIAFGIENLTKWSGIGVGVGYSE